MMWPVSEITPEASAGRIDDDVAARYPYLLAATYSRAFFQSADPADIHEYLLDLFEVTLRYCATIAMAQYLQDGAWDPRLSRDLLGLRRPSLGQWQGWLRDTLALYQHENRHFPVPELVTFFHAKHGDAIVAASQTLQRQMRTLRSDTAQGTAAGVTTQQFFDLLVAYRNRLAHGARPSPRGIEIAAEALGPSLRQLYAAMGFAAEYRLAHVRSVTVDFDPQGRQTYRYVITRLSGDTPRVVTLPKGLDEPFPNKQIYLLDPNADFHPIVSLHPLLLLSYCDGCDREQVFVLNMSDPDRQEYLAYQCTHHFTPTDYIDYTKKLIDTLERTAGEAPPPVAEASIADETLEPAAASTTDAASPDAVEMAAAPVSGLAATEVVARPPCAKCSTLNPPGAVYCGRCGSRLAPPAPAAASGPAICASCHTVNAAGSAFCGRCGRKL